MPIQWPHKHTLFVLRAEMREIIFCFFYLILYQYVEERCGFNFQDKI